MILYWEDLGFFYLCSLVVVMESSDRWPEEMPLGKLFGGFMSPTWSGPRVADGGKAVYGGFWGFKPPPPRNIF